MQDTSALLFSRVDAAKTDLDLVAHIERSEIYREYQKAFEATTGLPLAIRSVGSFHPPLHGSPNVNPFCALMAGKNKSCSACLQLQQKAETEAREKAATLDCLAGLSESSIPIRIGDRVVAHLQTGQVFRRKPSEAQFKRLVGQLGDWGTEADVAELRTVYFNSRVMTKDQYDSALRLVTIFAQHLSSLSNQLMVTENAAETPAISKARAFIVEHQGEQISLAQVAKSVNMSAFYFCKVFKRVTGLNFTKYLARVRVETVKNLLLNPHKRVSEAAYEAGFQSLSQFNRIFRRIVGEAPSDYRDGLHNPDRHGLARAV
jgi:AraC-like DNA-binding protein